MNLKQARIKAIQLAVYALNNEYNSQQSKMSSQGFSDGDIKLVMKEYQQIIDDLVNAIRLWEYSDNER